MNDPSPNRSSTSHLTDSAVRGRVANGTVTRVELVRQIAVVTRRTSLLAWLMAIPCVLGVALAPVVGGVSLLVKAFLAACVGGLAVFAVRRWGPRPRTADELPFWIKDVSGAEQQCLVRGTLPKGPPEQGSTLDVYGRRTSSGTILVRRLVTANGEVSRPRLPFGVVAHLVATWLVIGLQVATAVFLAWLLAFR
jgi:hypothetical protein